MNEMQAVNSAFVKLRRAVPLDSGQGKRVSKVVTTMVMVIGVGDVCFFLAMRCFNDAMFSNS